MLLYICGYKNSRLKFDLDDHRRAVYWASLTILLLTSFIMCATIDGSYLAFLYQSEERICSTDWWTLPQSTLSAAQLPSADLFLFPFTSALRLLTQSSLTARDSSFNDKSLMSIFEHLLMFYTITRNLSWVRQPWLYESAVLLASSWSIPISFIR